MRLNEMTSRFQIGLVLNAMGLTGIGAEVGVAFGENALFSDGLVLLPEVDSSWYVVKL
jgi:hypothetical protein